MFWPAEHDDAPSFYLSVAGLNDKKRWTLRTEGDTRGQNNDLFLWRLDRRGFTFTFKNKDSDILKWGSVKSL